jgi:hypothetical protein
MRHGQHVGLLFTWVLSLAALHWFVPVLYLLPWNEGDRYLFLTVMGLRQSTFAMVGLLLGAEVTKMFVERSGWAADRSAAPRIMPSRLVNLHIIVGAVLYAASFTGVGRLPTFRALVTTGSMLMVVGFGLKCWNAWISGRPVQSWLWLAATGVFPVATVAAQGYLGYGLAAMVMVFGFFVSFHRLRWKAVVIAVALAYAGLSVYVTYMRDRDNIRAAVWGGATTAERFALVETAIRSFEWFDWREEEHLERINIRLDQNLLVGAAVRHVRAGRAELAQGATFVEAALAVIPRAVWPDKPIVAGSGDVVSRYTGFTFGEETSVGVGQVLEGYINFGSTGVVVGFFVLAVLVILADRKASVHLGHRDARGFLLWYLPGLSLLQVGGSLTEMTAMATGSWVVALAFLHFAGEARRATPDRVEVESPVETAS